MPGEASPCCPICGGSEFIPGPNGRRAPDGSMPRCASCRSLERHRAYRVVFHALGPDRFADLRALQFSPDRVVEPAWFAQHEVSEFGTETALDLQAIARDDDSYDAIVVNHVLEHVRDDAAAVRELDRVVRPDGFVFLSVPDPARTPATRHYGRAREDKHGHWRIYGPDVADLLQNAAPEMRVVVTQPADPVTGAPDTAYFLTRSQALADDIVARLQAAGIAAQPHGLAEA
ncbi:methyltransferase domain-containing protein [Amorphus sp. 3PC139-8]|uniref:methyltransferase domain-containing protein n=1 Tax=Amorphus sp. 3PC139-8 TaxID=2735676 RepID=UPI00345DB8B6